MHIYTNKIIIMTKFKYDYASLFLRLALGVMYIVHGYTKLFIWGPSGTAAYFASIGMPSIIAYGTIAFEIIGGILLILGPLTRIISGLATIQLFVIITVHFNNGFLSENPNGGWEYPLFMFLTSISLFFLGSGRISIPLYKFFRNL